MRGLATILTGCLALAGVAAAETYPAKPITLIVPLAAGSTADILARTLGNELSRAMGQTIVIDNRAGAGGTIAMSQVARAAPDGYTMAVISQGTHVFNLGLYRKLDYDPFKDFAVVTPIAFVSNVMIVPPGDAAAAPLDIAARAKANPAQITFSSGGNGTSHHMSGVLFGRLTGSELVHVPYRGAPQAVTAVMQGEVAMGFFNTPSVLPQIKEGKVKALGVTSLKRSPHLPALPTLDESGIKGYDVITWMGLSAPPGTPGPIVQRWHAEVSKLMGEPGFREKIVGLGFDPMEQVSPEQFAAFIRADAETWVPIVKASGATVD